MRPLVLIKYGRMKLDRSGELVPWNEGSWYPSFKFIRQDVAIGKTEHDDVVYQTRRVGVTFEFFNFCFTLARLF